MGSNITNEKYDLVKMERLKQYLENNDERGKPRYYEIYVDNLKAVDKTNDVRCFDDYTMYLNEDSRIVKVLIYSPTESSPRNDKFIYTIDTATQKKAEELSGIEVQQKIETALTAEREKELLRVLREDLQKKTQQLQEAEEYIEELSQALEEETARKRSPRDIQLGTIAAVALEEVIQRNPGWLKNVPLLGVLSGIISPNKPEDKSLEGPGTNTTTETTASYTKKQAATELDDTSQAKINFFNHMESVFTTEQMQMTLAILEALVNYPDDVKTTYELLLNKPGQKTGEKDKYNN